MAGNPASPPRLGRYEILGSLAQGGMAELFIARLAGIEGFAKRVVVKRVLPGLARDGEFIAMFLEEARLAATLDHQNIIQVHDIGHDPGGPFFAMELLHGGDVAQLLRATAERGGLPLGIALEIARGACAGLHYVHERCEPSGAPLGLVHRDVSPQNLFVTFGGAVKLLDFGIAKAVHRISDHYTRSGTLRGKLPYMAPEQCRGEVLDRRSDIFSLCIVLWEMTVGARLHGSSGEGDFDLLKAIVDQDSPPPSTRRSDYPPDLERIVLRGLRRDREARYQTADELAADLEAFVRTRSLWVSPRELAAFMASTFPDRAAAWRRIESEPPTGRGASDPAPPGGPTRDLPSLAPESGRSRRIVGLAIGAVAVAAAIGLGYVLGRGDIDPRSGPAPSGDEALAAPAGEDDHWFQPGDYLISMTDYQGGKLSNLRVAKMLTPPARPGERATFLDSRSRQVETPFYWRTRIAQPGDLTIGTLAFCMARPHRRAASRPEDKQQARARVWIAARVTEIADLQNGTVSIGGVSCPVAATRVVSE
jgi:serine/threonine protein kinase